MNILWKLQGKCLSVVAVVIWLVLPSYIPVVEGLGKGQNVCCLSGGSQPKDYLNKATECWLWKWWKGVLWLLFAFNRQLELGFSFQYQN